MRTALCLLLEIRWYLMHLYWRARRSQSASVEVNQYLWIWLKDTLEHYPYWASGHLRFADLSFRLSKHSFAYSSSVAVEQLAPLSSIAVKAKLILARCLIKNMELASAKVQLENILASSSSPFIQAMAKEYLADCLLLEEKFLEASHVLRSIPEKSRSASATVALQYAQGKCHKESA